MRILLAVCAIPGVAASLFAACCGQAHEINLAFDFSTGACDWQADFADYPPEHQEGFELQSGIRPLPAEIGPGDGFFINGVNRSDDLFMFLKRRLTAEDGIVADQGYTLSFEITFASDAPTGCMGVGGAPGEAVFLKAGASPVEPLPVLDPTDDHLRMNVDKGNQGSGGAAASVVGHIANGIPCEEAMQSDPFPYVSLQRTHTHDTTVTSSSSGELWLLVGTDSGYESRTALYYQTVTVRLAPTGQ